MQVCQCRAGRQEAGETNQHRKEAGGGANTRKYKYGKQKPSHTHTKLPHILKDGIVSNSLQRNTLTPTDNLGWIASSVIIRLEEPELREKLHTEIPQVREKNLFIFAVMQSC